MNSIARLRRCFSSSSRLMICAWIETSSADTGSSATRSAAPPRAPARSRRAGAGRPRGRADRRSREIDRKRHIVSSSSRPGRQARSRRRCPAPATARRRLADRHRRVDRGVGVLKDRSAPCGGTGAARPSKPSTSLPSKTISPAVGSISRRTQRPIVVLPEPDSPAMPSTSPRPTSNDTSSTAWTCPTHAREQMPRVMSYYFRRLTDLRASGLASCARLASISRQRWHRTRQPSAISLERGRGPVAQALHREGAARMKAAARGQPA